MNMQNKSNSTWRVACLIGLLTVVTLSLLCRFWAKGAFVTDDSAEFTGSKLTWNGKNYSSVGGIYTEEKRIAKTADGWDVNEIREDPDHNFVVVRSFLDQYLMVADDYTIPTSGRLTMVNWHGDPLTDPEFLEAVLEISVQKNTSFTYETENISMVTDQQHMREVFFAYENCPVATVFQGYLGKVDGKWVMTTDIEKTTHPQPYLVGCHKIPDEYESILERYFK